MTYPLKENRAPSAAARGLGQRSGRIVELAAGLARRRHEARAFYDLVDDEQVFRILSALGLRMADEHRRHQLMVLGAVEGRAGLTSDFRRQLQPFERPTDLHRL